MREFYAQQHIQFDEPAASLAVNSVLNNPDLAADLSHSFAARNWLIFRAHVLLQPGIHGRFALSMKLYLREPYRRQKLGRAVVRPLRKICAGKRHQGGAP